MTRPGAEKPATGGSIPGTFPVPRSTCFARFGPYPQLPAGKHSHHHISLGSDLFIQILTFVFHISGTWWISTPP